MAFGSEGTISAGRFSMLVEYRETRIEQQDTISMIVQAVKWVGGVEGFLELVDQRRLPAEFIKFQCRDIEVLFEAIKTLAVRGAPAIGVSAAYGLVLAMQKLTSSDDLSEGLKVLAQSAESLSSSRPTAVNLFWALERVRRKAQEFVSSQPHARLPRGLSGGQASSQELQEAVLAEANAIYQEDVEMCLRIGQNGEAFIKQNYGILTHCNAGALATAGQGTALSVMFEAHKKGKKFTVYVDETRPLLQGARLTAWELKQAEIDVTVICDNMAGWLMKQGKIDAVITGADRIAANGDAANKIGTYSLSILAREHDVPFYIAAPSSTFDLDIRSGAEIPIEQREASEVTTFAKTQIAPDGINVYNPAFDVTEARDITAIITERGVIENPNAENISEHLM
jgi:methylthioribose-1-phosphate isomerase